MTRTADSLRHHFEVERELALRLRASRREERAELVPRLYAELYRRVPDHPRIMRSQSDGPGGESFRSRMQLLETMLSPEIDFVEFGAGDGGFCRGVRPLVHRAVALEVCEQGARATAGAMEPEWVFYNGLQVPLPDAAFHLAFSYQVLEHVHPSDVPLHLQEAARILKHGGTYVLSTPHAFSGPHDISRHFTDRLETFHLKEWTYAGLAREMRRAGFRKVSAYLKGRNAGWPGMMLWLALEGALCLLPARSRRKLARRGLNNVVVAAVR